jgi:hypothetical protein
LEAGEIKMKKKAAFCNPKKRFFFLAGPLVLHFKDDL